MKWRGPADPFKVTGSFSTSWLRARRVRFMKQPGRGCFEIWSEYEIRRLRAYAAGDRSEPPPAQYAKGPGHRLWCRRFRHDRARSQRAVLRAEEGSLSLDGPRDGPE